MSKGLEVEEDAPCSAVRELKSLLFAVEHSSYSQAGEHGGGSESCHSKEWYVSPGLGQSNLGGKCWISRERRNISSCKQGCMKITIFVKPLTNAGVMPLVE